MARMFDRVIARGLCPPLGFLRGESELASWSRIALDIQRDMRRCEVLVVDNVAEYLYAGTDQEEWNLKRDFPCIAPPFETFWMEWRAPSRIVSCETGVNKPHPNNLCTGVMFYARSYESEWRELREMSEEDRATLRRRQDEQSESILAQMSTERKSYVAERLRQCASGGWNMESLGDLYPAEKWLCAVAAQRTWERRTGGNVYDQVLPENSPAWLIEAYGMTEHRRPAGVMGPYIRWDFQVDARGAIITDPLIASVGSAPGRELALDCHPMIFPCLLALSFLNCKNVRRVENEPDAPLARKYEKKTGKPLCRFWTLEIDPMREVLKTEGQCEATGLRKALHICRGHFAVYDDRPLFGKHKGTFWRPSHVRGAVQEGVVDKVYAMKKPREKRLP